VIKPRHSAFYASALEALLAYMGVQRLIISGLSSHQCVLFTANDAYVREYQLKIPRDCIAAPSVQQTRFALRYFQMVLSADIRTSAQLRNWKRARRGLRAAAGSRSGAAARG
jgi:nicotinamidase-related amidase